MRLWSLLNYFTILCQFIFSLCKAILEKMHLILDVMLPVSNFMFIVYSWQVFIISSSTLMTQKFHHLQIRLPWLMAMLLSTPCNNFLVPSKKSARRSSTVYLSLMSFSAQTNIDKTKSNPLRGSAEAQVTKLLLVVKIQKSPLIGNISFLMMRIKNNLSVCCLWCGASNHLHQS